MHFPFLAAGTAVTTLALSGIALGQDVAAWRLFVADHAAPQVTALDHDGETLGVFQLTSPASLYAGHDGSVVYAVQGEGDAVSAITTGLVVDDHGDHADIEVSDPRLLNASVQGERPVHFVDHHGRIALFFDDEGKARILDQADWVEGVIEPREVDSGAPHHGVAVAWGEHVILSEPNPEDPSELPIGVRVLDVDGEQVGDLYGCADLHGEASSGTMLAIACAEGLLLVTGSDAPQIERINYSGLPDGKATTLLGGVGLQYFLGNYGPDRVVLIDPAEDTPYRLVDLPTRRVHFAVDPIRPRFAYVFTEDGDLHQLDVISGEIVNSIEVTGLYSMDGEWHLPRPRIAVAGEVIAVGDPLEGQIHLIDIETFSLAETMDVDGVPFGLVAVGATGQTHE